MSDRAGQTRVGDVRPIPPRYWWLKRIGVAAGVVITLLIGLRWGWGWYADRQLRAEIDRYLAAGEPIYLTDFDPPPMADKDNASLVLQKAADGLAVLTQKQTDLISEVNRRSEIVVERRDEVRAIIEATASVRALVRSARNIPGTDWGIRMRSPAFCTLLANLQPQYRLCGFLAVVALHCHSIGKDAEAVEALRDILVQSRHLNNQVSIIVHSWCAGADMVAARTVENLARDLRIVRATPKANAGLSATRFEEVQVTIAMLLDDTFRSAGLVRAMQAERAACLDAGQLVAGAQVNPLHLPFASLRTPSAGDRVLGFLSSPMIHLDTVRALKYMTVWVEAVGQTTYPACQARVLPDRPPHRGLQGTIHIVSDMLSGPYFRYRPLPHFRGLADRRMAAVALAIRLYELDRGRRPARLDELVPEYLPFVPQDPFARDARPIGYNPRAKHPVLYSVGPNGIDEHGELGFQAEGDLYWDAKDRPLFLDGHRSDKLPAITTTTNAPGSAKTGNH